MAFFFWLSLTFEKKKKDKKKLARHGWQASDLEVWLEQSNKSANSCYEKKFKPSKIISRSVFCIIAPSSGQRQGGERKKQ